MLAQTFPYPNPVPLPPQVMDAFWITSPAWCGVLLAIIVVLYLIHRAVQEDKKRRR